MRKLTDRYHPKINYMLIFLILFFTVQLKAAIQEQKLIASDGAMVDLFGGSVSISGNYAVIGANQAEINGDRTGAAYVFEHDGNNWLEVTKLIPPQAFENYGASVSISGNRIIIGAPNAFVNAHQFAGAAYIYHRDVNGVWNFIERISASDEALGDRFGQSVSIDGDQLIVGATQNDEVVNGSGAVYVFDYINNSWLESQILLASDPVLNDHFGSPIQLEGDRLIVGAPDSDDTVIGASTGKVYVFEKNGATWTETKILNAGTDIDTGDRFGNAINLSGNRVVVGAAENDDDGTRSGSAYVFEYDQVMAIWDAGQKLTAFDAAAYDRFGAAVSISGNKMLIGAPANDEGQSNSGSVYSYFHDGNSWNFQERILHTDTPTTFTDSLGNALDLDGNRSIIGSYFDDGVEGSTFNSGAAYIFDLDIAPVAVDDSQTISEDLGVVFIRVLDNDTDPDGGLKIIDSYTQSAHGTVGTSGPSISYRPDNNYCNDGMATDDFTYTLNGGSQATVSLTVTCVNDFPEAVGDSTNITEDDPITSIDVLANDFDIDGGDEIFVGSVTQPKNGNVTFTTTDLSYTPDSDYCNNSSTLDTFTYTLTTGSTTEVSVMVACVNDAPSFNLLGDVQANGNVLVNVTDYSLVNFTNSINFGPVDESSQQVLEYLVNIISDSSNVINNIGITNNGTLNIEFTLNPGVAIISVALRDNGGTSNGGVDTSNALTFNVTFVDEMFNDGFEDVVTSKTIDFIEFSKSISNEITFDQEGSVILYKNHLFEIPENTSQNEIKTLIELWMKEVDLGIN